MNQKLSIPPIEIVPINDHLVYFYSGRHPDWQILQDMKYGLGSYAIFKDDEAVVFDTMVYPEQAKQVKDYLEEQGAKKFTVINSHWHYDHIVGNYLYEGCNIIGCTDTRGYLLANKEAIEGGAGTAHGYPAFPVVPPNITFDDRLDLWIKDIKIELHRFSIHEKGHIMVYLPGDSIGLAADMLEDPVFYFRIRMFPPEVQIADFERMLSLGFKRVFPIHGHLPTIKKGGYDRSLIRNNMEYAKKLLQRVDQEDFLNSSLESYIGDSLKKGELHWWDPYAYTHQWNLKEVYNYYHPGVIEHGDVL